MRCDGSRLSGAQHVALVRGSEMESYLYLSVRSMSVRELIVATCDRYIRAIGEEGSCPVSVACVADTPR